MTAAPTKVRFHVLTLITVVAFLMYLDRICLTTIVGSESFRNHLSLTQDQLGWVKSAFFWAYALFMVPAGWLSDRYGTRILVTLYIALWSIFTVATSFSEGFVALILMRIGCGIAEAGYYPASSSLITRWAHIDWRGTASSVVSLGGRVGNAVAPVITVLVILKFGDWRWAGWSYGLVGVAVAVVFWWVYRNHPKLHPWCNDAEVSLLAEGRGDFSATPEPPRSFPWAAALKHRTLWLANAFQFLTNIGWAFLVLYLEDYFRRERGLDHALASKLTTTALTAAIVSLPLGGLLTDHLARRFGKRKGRIIPLLVTRLFAIAGYLIAMRVESPWGAAAMFGFVAFFNDLGLPAMWALMQDISGRHQAQLFGWGNMWGNFGAALVGVMFPKIVESNSDHPHFSTGIYACTAAFAISAFLAPFINAEDKVVVEPEATTPP
jgi:MFS family permease